MPMPPNANAIFEETNIVVRATFAEAMAKAANEPRSKLLVTELDVDDTKVDFGFMLDTFGLKKLKQNIEKRAAIEKQITMITEEWIDNLTVPTRDLTSRHGDKYRMQAELRGKAVGRWQDQQVAALLAEGGPAFVTPSFDNKPFFAADHVMTLGGQNIPAYSNLDSGGAGEYWYLFDASFITPIFLNWKTRPEPRDLGPESEHARKFFEVMWNFYADAGFGLGLWQFAYASNQVLDEAHFDAARQAMEGVPTYGLTEGATTPMGVMPTILVVGRSNRLAAEKLIKSGTINGGDPNPLYNAVDVLALPMLP